MKKTPFLSCILAALIACAGIPQAHADWDVVLYNGKYDIYYDLSVYANRYWDYSREMYLDVGRRYLVSEGCTATLIDGGVSGYVQISQNAKLIMGGPGGSYNKPGELIQWVDSASGLWDYYYGGEGGWKSDTHHLHIYMQGNSSLDYRNEDLWLGPMTFDQGSTVNITAGMLSVKSIGNWHRDEFNINATINLQDQTGNIGILNIENFYATTINLNVAQTMNLRVAKGVDYLQLYTDANGAIKFAREYTNTDEFKTRLNEASIYLPNSGTSHIEGYLGGTSKIYLGMDSTVQGLYQARDGGGYNISWLLNDIVLRENYRATMKDGYYGGTVTMESGSSLKFSMFAIPAGVDTAKPAGGATIVMKGNNTLDLGSKRTDNLVIEINGTGNTIQNGTLTGSYTLQNVTLTLNTDFSNASISMQGNTTLDLSRRSSNFDLTVRGTGNTLTNGAFTGTLTLAENSALTADSAMCSWDGPTSITMENGSRLDMATGAGKDIWINNLSALKVNGTATINNACLRVRSSQAPDHVYVLTDGVANLKGENTYYVLTGDEGQDYFDLNGKTANFGIISWNSEKKADIVIKNGTIDKSVEIYGTSTSRPYSKLKLEGVTLGSNAAFTMGNGAELDLGSARGTAWLYPANGATVTVSNGRVGLQGGTPEYWACYTMASQNGKTTVTGNGYTLNLGEKVTFATDKVACFLVDSETIGNQANPVNIDVTTHGHFIFGMPPQQIGEKTQIVNGNVSITYVGAGSTVAMDKDVDIYYQLVGSLKVNAANGRVNAGIIGKEGDTTSTATVEAKQVYLSGFIGKSLTLKAANNGGAEAIHVEANAMAKDDLTFDANVDGAYGDIVFGGKLSGSTIELNGKNITGTGNPGDSQLPSFVEFDKCTILARGSINIGEAFKARGSSAALTMTAAGNITVDLVGMDPNSLATATLTSNGGVTMRSFSGGALNVSAMQALTISGSVAASGTNFFSPAMTSDKYAAVLEGGSVGIGSLSADNGRAYIKSRTGDITIAGTLSAKDSSTLVSATSITVGGNVTRGALTATAGNSISLQAITIGDKTAELTSQGGSITANSFTGGSLKATAKEAVTFAGSVTVSDWGENLPGLGGRYAAVIEGGSVQIKGSVTAKSSGFYVKSTVGDISIATNGPDDAEINIGNPTCFGTLHSAGNITIGKVEGFTSLAAYAAKSVTVGDIGSRGIVGSVELTALGGSINARSLKADTLKAYATQAVSFTGTVEVYAANKWRPSQGGDQMYAVVLEGDSVSVDGSLKAFGEKEKAYIRSSGIGKDITIGGTLRVTDSSTLESAGNITIGGDVTGGALTATAAQSISLQTINIGSNAAVLTATNGGITAGDFIGYQVGSGVAGGTLTATAGDSITLGNLGTNARRAGTTVLTAGGGITAGNFTGGALKASAKGAVTFNGGVTASSGNAELTGGSVSTGGALAANNAGADITSTTGDIKLGGEVRVDDSITLNSAGSITGEAADMHGANLTVTAEQSIALKNIDIFISPATLTAKSGSITAGKVTVVNLTANAAGNIALGDVEVDRTGAVIVSTGGNVELNTFSGSGAQISAQKGSIQVNSAVSGTGNTFLAGQSVAFAAAASESGLSNATVRAPLVIWENGTTLANVTLTGYTDTDSALVTSGGSLVLKENSRVQGNVTLGGTGTKVTVAGSTITGTVSGTNPIGIELDNGHIGSAENFASLTSTGASAITGLTGALVIPSLILNGGSLTLSAPQTESGSAQGQALVSTLTVTQTSRLNANLELSNNATLNLTLDAENASTPLLAVNGQLTAELFPFLTINLQETTSVNGGESYALISVKDGKTPDFWDLAVPFMTVTGMGATVDDLSWKDGILYFQNGTELKRAVWSPGENHLWNTTDKNWTQDGHLYRYRDGVDVVFNDTGKGGEVQLEGALAPKGVLVEGNCDYTFTGTGKITGEAALTKNGSGTLTIATANDYTGGTTINGGTLAMKNAQALGTGTITMAGGATLDLGGFAAGNSVTLQGSASIRNGSLTGTLALADGASLNWWGEDLNLSGGATLGKDAHLYLNGKSLNNAVLTASGATIHYGTVTGNLTLADSVSYSWDALRGNGLTLSGGVTLGNGTLLNLDGSTVTNPITLKGTATLGNGTLNGAFSVAGGHTLTLCGNLDGTGDITLGERATLNLGNHTLGKGVVVHKSATLGNGTLNGTLTLAEGTAFSWSGDSLQLNGGVTLKEGAALILGSHTLAGNVTLEGSAFIGGGTINSGFSVAGGHTLTLCGNLEGMGFITLGDTATLDLAGFELDNSVTLEGSATIGNGALHSPLSLEGGKALKLIGDLSGTGTIIMGNGSRLDLNGKTLDLAVDATFGSSNVIAGDGTINGDVTIGVYMDITGTLNGSGRIILNNSASLYAGTINNDVLVTRDKANTQANIFSGTLNGTLTLADNASLCLRGELAVTGAVTMGDNTELDLGGHMLDKGVALQGSATIGNGRINGELSVAAGKTLTLNGNLEGYGNVYLNGGTTLNLNNHELGKSVYLQGSATVGSGTINGTINVTAGNTLTLSGNLNGSTGNLHLNDSTTLDLNSHVLDMRHVILAGSTTIGGGTLNTGDTILSVNGGTTLTLSGDLAGSGSVHMFDNSTLNLGNHMLYKDVYLVGPATISAGSLAKIRTIGSGTLDLGGRLHVDELDVWSERTINMNGNTLEVQTLDMRNHTLTLNGKGELIIGEGTIGGAIVKTGAGRLDIQGSASLTGLDAQGGELCITGTADAKGGIASLKAAEGATVELVHTNATTANETQAYKGNLVIGNGSTVTAGCTDGWAYESSNSLTLQKGGKLDLANHRWIIAPGNKVTLAGGEIAGAGHDTLGALDFHGGASVVAVTEDSSLSARLRVRGTGSDSLTFDVAEDKVLSVTGDIISCGADEDDKGTVYKTGAGTMVMSGSNAMVESGTINVQAGILKVTGNSNPLGAAAVNVTGGATLELGGAGAPAGTVTLAGGTLKISEGSKDFALVAIGTGNLLDFNGGCTFTGSLEMQDGSSLEMAMGEGKNSWIEDVSRLSVDGESATLANAYLRIKESYTLGNGVENLKGEGVTAFCMDGSTFNLARGTSNLDIIVWSGQSNQIRNGMIGTKVDIRSGSKLALLGATIGDGAAILMEDQACLDMNYGEARLSWFTFTGETATIDNGTLLVAAGESVQLGTRLQGSDTIISLGKGANLDLNGYSMDSSKIDLADDSSTVSGGTLSGDVTVKSGKTLRLGVDQSIAGAVKLNSASMLALGSGCSVEGAVSGSGTIVKENGGTASVSGGMQGFSGSLEVQGGILNLMNAASQGVQDVTIGANSTLGVFIGGDPTPETASEGTLTMTHGHTLTAGKDATLNANLVLQSGSILDVSDAKGRAGLQMGSTVTLEPGNVLLSEADMDAVNGLSFMGKYDLFSGVDGLSLDNGVNFLVELGLADSWVNAADVFGNDLFKDSEKEYYVFYSGASNKGGAGGNVGTVYVMLLPEPTTGILSLLALAALAARRRKH